MGPGYLHSVFIGVVVAGRQERKQEQIYQVQWALQHMVWNIYWYENKWMCVIPNT